MDTLAPAPPPTGLTPNADDRQTVAAQVAVEQVRILYERTPQALWGGLAFAALLAWGFAPIIGAGLAWGWYGAKVLLWAVRYTQWRRFTRDADWPQRAERWRRQHDLLATLDGLTWGAVGLAGHAAKPSLLDGVVLASLVGVASVGVFTLSSHLRQAMHFITATLLPVFLVHLLQGGVYAGLVAGGLAIYFSVILVEGRSSHGRMLELLRLRFENAAIADQRHRALLLAEHSNAAKSRFLATVSHELRTPLNGILGMSQLMALEGLTPEQASRNLVVQNSAEHLLSVIGDLLDVSRIEFGRIELHPQPVALQALLDEVAALLRPVAQAKGLHLQWQTGPALPLHVQCDPVRVKQVLHNLVGNAIKFTAAGEVRLAASQRDGLIVFTVSDTGEGIPPAEVERIFSAFEQAPASTDARHAGTGLGLTISRHLARAMGGDVVCRLSAGPGAVFEFTMADVPASDEPATSTTAPHALPALPPAWVLVVEDNAVNALVATGMLEHLGLRWRLASHGEQALALLAEQPFDLVLMDCQMPVLDGFEATRRWRATEAARPGAKRLPIIALTAFAVEGDSEKCHAAGMDGHLAKPFTLQALADELSRHLRTTA
ncbi:ATP-binding protein [Ideonella sp.]|uniref:ATP-binding protein n=1 Tax=Ideonella sp. TaxID=1929293 RepID=UPI0035B10F62